MTYNAIKELIIKLKNVTTGVISDTHFPGHVDGALDFVLRTGKRWGVKQWLHIGDMIDHHYISRHPTEPEAFNPIQEVALVRKELQRWTKAIPNLFICTNSHDRIPARQAKTLGMPELFLRPLNEVYNLPDTWVWSDRFTIFDRTLIEHGLGSTGMYGAKNTSKNLGCSWVQGHTHAHGATFDLPRPTGDCAAMNVGCLMDEKKYFAKYGENFKIPVSLGMGIIEADDEMYFIKYKEK